MFKYIVVLLVVATGALAADIPCIVCKDLAVFAIDEFEKVETPAQLETKLEGYCSDLIVDVFICECDKIVDKYVPEIFNYLNKTQDQATAQELCNEIDLCSELNARLADVAGRSSDCQRKLASKNAPTQESGVECVVCKDLAKFAIDEFEHIETEAQLETKLEGYCEELTIGVLIKECDRIVDTYVPKIFEYLNSTGSDSRTAVALCDYIDLCAAFSAKIAVLHQKQAIFSRPVFDVKGIECAACEFVLNEGIKLIEESETEADAQKSLDGVCKKSSFLDSICEDFVNTYLPKIYAYVKANGGKDAKEVCHYIEIC